MEAIQELIETVIYTGCIREEVPVSIIIVGPSGIGKSKLLSRYQSPSLRMTDSISSKGLYDVAVADRDKNEVRFLLIPDFNPTLSRRQSTVDATIANLLSFTSDGTVRIDDGREQKECKHDPIGIITASTDDIYKRQEKKWFALGLRRRIIPVFFNYTIATLEKLQTLVMEDKIHSTNPPGAKLTLSKRVRPALGRNHSIMLKGMSHKFAQLLGKSEARSVNGNRQWFVRNVIPISPQVTLGCLIRAHALRAGRATVNDDDYQFVCRFLDFCDPEHPREI